jgi:hypothetical protein
MERSVAIHLWNLKFNEEKFHSALADISDTRYSLVSLESNPPLVTDCISAVRYIIQKSTWANMPKAYIGDLGRVLVDRQFGGARLIPIEDQSLWDLVLFFRKSRRLWWYMNTHIGIFTDDVWNYAHSTISWYRNDNISKKLQAWRVSTCRQILALTDPRKSSRNTKNAS